VHALYRNKLKSPKEAVEVVQSGNIVEYGYFNGKPVVCDQALAARAEELQDVHVYSAVTLPPLPEVIAKKGSFVYHDWQFSKVTRMVQKMGLAYYSPILYHQVHDMYRDQVCQHRNVVICQVCPMDDHGYFNLGPHNSETLVKMEHAETVILEVNRHLPVCLGGAEESVHVSMVNAIVEAPEEQVPFAAPLLEPSEAERQIAEHVMEFIKDGSCIQLGIGGLPSAVGGLIAESDLRDLGGHTEMFVDSYVEMIESGRMNGKRKFIDRHRVAFTFAIGSQRMYDFMDSNPALASYPVNYTNDPRVICRLDDFVSINNAIQIDLFSQVNAESMGPSQISGNGGMWDFVLGSQWSRGGKSFICLTSTFQKEGGERQSRIVPRFSPGSITTIPRQMVDYVVTEFGAVRMKGQPTWKRAELLVSVAHPDFREELIQQAEAMNLWRPSREWVAFSPAASEESTAAAGS